MKLTTITIGILPVVFSQELTCGPFQHPLNGECVPNVCNCANGIPVPNSECVTHDSEQCQEVVSDDTTEEESEFACDAGFYCPDGKDRIACPAGSYCPENSVLPIDCPAGTFNVISGVSSIADCAECIEGNYCEAGSEFPIACPVNTYCPSASAAPTPCPPGFYSYEASVSIDDCLDEADFVCPAGFFCEIPTQQRDCPNNFYCPEGSNFAIACPAGTYNELLNQIDESACLICEAGFYCTELQKIECQPGQLCLEGSTMAIDCPAGFYCPDSTAQIACPGGTYSDTAGHAYDACTKCPTGTISNVEASIECFECEGELVPNLVHTECVEKIECEFPEFAFGNACINCPPGRYITEEQTCEPCQLGTYNDQASATECKLCPIGSFCDEEGMTIGKPCYGGFYCPEEGAIDEIPCPENTVAYGSAAECVSCPEKMHASEMQDRCVECPENTFYNTDNHECMFCPEGFVPSDDMTICVDINGPEEVICPRGTETKNDEGCASACIICDDCRPGFYEEENVCLACPAGTFSAYNKGVSCTECPDGFYCPETALTAPLACPKDNSCEDNTKAVPCPEGFVSKEGESACYEPICETGLVFNDITYRCDQCPPGTRFVNDHCEWCENNSISKIYSALECTACPLNTVANEFKTECILAETLTCPLGFESSVYVQEDLVGDTIQAFPVCEPCQPGQFGVQDPVTGNFSCQICPAGTFSNAAGATECITCPSGTLTNSDFTGCDPCPAGTFHDVRETGTCLPCLADTYQPLAGKDDCLPCGVNVLANSTRCGYENSVPGASISLDENFQAVFTPCPPGSYESSMLCIPCDAGYAQPLEGQSTCDFCWKFEVEGSLEAFNFVNEVQNTNQEIHENLKGKVVCEITIPECGEGRELKTNDESEYVCEPCSPGKYLNIESGVCQDCPQGTYSDRFYSHGACTVCPPGTFCEEEGSVRPTSCEAGFYCPGEGNIDQTVCPEDTHVSYTGADQCFTCAGGSVASSDRTRCVECKSGQFERDGQCFNCLEGTYAPESGMSQCLTCESGYVSDDGTFCEPGCPFGHIRYREEQFDETTIPSEDGLGVEIIRTIRIYIACIPCEPGFYRSGTECLACPILTFNPFEAQEKCQICTGTVLNQGTECFDDQSICPPGEYNNGKECLPCEVGFYKPDASNAPTCIPSGYGRYCPEIRMTEPLSCRAGNYCPKEANGEEVICPAGYFCIEESKDPVLCVPEEGFYQFGTENEDREGQKQVILVNNQPGQSECIWEEVEIPEPGECIRERVFIQENGTIIPEKEFSKEICVMSGKFKFGKAPVMAKCQPEKVYSQWSYDQETGFVKQNKRMCQHGHDHHGHQRDMEHDDQHHEEYHKEHHDDLAVSMANPFAEYQQRNCYEEELCWTVKTVGLNRRVVLDHCRSDCYDHAVPHQRFYYQYGRVRLVGTDFCVAWYPNNKFLELNDCKFDIYG